MIVSFDEFVLSFSCDYPRISSLRPLVVAGDQKKKGIEKECSTHTKNLITKVIISMQIAIRFFTSLKGGFSKATKVLVMDLNIFSNHPFS